MLFECLDIRWNTPSRVWCITSPCLDIRWNTSSRVWCITSQCLDIRWNTPSRVWCITSQCLDIRWNTPSRVSYITSLCSEIRWTTCVYSCVFVSLCKGNRRSNFESLPSHLSKYVKYEDSLPLVDGNRNNLLTLDRMNNYLYGPWCHIVNFSNCNLFPQRT